jgi:hypothetical protein
MGNADHNAKTIMVMAPAFRRLILYVGERSDKAVYEVDPLMCPKCGGTMKVIAFIEEAVVIETRSTGCAESTAKPPEGLQLGWLQ